MSRRLARSIVAVALGAVVFAALGGCYQKVIRASGPGAWQYKVEETDMWDNPNAK